MFKDGSATNKGYGIVIVLKTLEGTFIEHAVRLGFEASNNESGYEALIMKLKKTKLLDFENLVMYCDSQLIVNQLTGEYSARNENMEAYIERFPITMQMLWQL